MSAFRAKAVDKIPAMISVNPGISVEDAFEAILRRELARLRKWEPVALLGEDIEGVHRVRVALRRMRSALVLFRPVVPRAVSRSLADEMRWAAKELDLARDLDVYITENFSEKKRAPAKRALLEIAEKRRLVAYRQVADLVQCERFEILQSELQRWLDTRAWREPLAAQDTERLECDVTPFAAQVLENHLRRVSKKGKNIHKLSDDALHQLRIECKKLRYATEFFSPLFDKTMLSFTRHLKTLQDILGALHDCAVIRDLQNTLLEDNRDPRIRRVADKLEAQRVKEARALKKVLKKRWGDFIAVKRPWRHCL